MADRQRVVLVGLVRRGPGDEEVPGDLPHRGESPGVAHAARGDLGGDHLLPGPGEARVFTVAGGAAGESGQGHQPGHEEHGHAGAHCSAGRPHLDGQRLAVARVPLEDPRLLHHLLDRLDLDREPLRDHLGLRLPDDDQVLQAPVEPLLRHPELRLDREDHAGPERVALAHVVRGHPHLVAERAPLRRLPVGLHELLRRLLVRGPGEAGRGRDSVHLGGRLLHHRLLRGAGADRLQDRPVGGEVEGVELLLGRGEAAVHRPHPRDVAHVVADVRGVVHENHLAVLHGPSAGGVVREPGVLPARHERVVGLALRPVPVVDEAGHPVELVFDDPGLGRAHRLEDGETGEARRPPDESDLARALDEARPSRVGVRLRTSSQG